MKGRRHSEETRVKMGLAHKKTFPSYDEAQNLVLTSGIKTKWEYEVGKRELRTKQGLPSSPEVVYKKSGNWTSWPDFLGTAWLPFEEARNLVRKLGFKRSEDYFKNRPANVPAMPEQVYKHKGWVNWGDYLGHGVVAPRVVASKRKTYLREILKHRDLLSAADLLQILKSSRILNTLQTLMPRRSLSEILDALKDGKWEEAIDVVPDATDTEDNNVPLERKYLDQTNKVSAKSVRSLDRLAGILDEETLCRLMESQLSRLRNKYINEGLASVESILA